MEIAEGLNDPDVSPKIYERLAADEIEDVVAEELEEGGLRTDANSLRSELRRAVSRAEELLTWPDDKLEALATRLRAKELEEDDEGLFFNQPKASHFDIDFWVKADSWTLDEAVALSFDKNPASVNQSALEVVRNASPFAARFYERIELVERALQGKALSEPIQPLAFAKWARSKGFDSRALEAVAPPQPEKPLHARAEHTLYKIIYILAATEFRDIKDAEIQKIKKRIVEDAPLFGLTADDESVADALKKAISYVRKVKRAPQKD